MFSTEYNNIDLKYEGKELFGTQIAGVTANMGEIEEKTIEEGRFIAPHEVELAAYVTVIGGDVRIRIGLGRGDIDQHRRRAGTRDAGAGEAQLVPFGVAGPDHIDLAHGSPNS